jgi:hypothetical protein
VAEAEGQRLGGGGTAAEADRERLGGGGTAAAQATNVLLLPAHTQWTTDERSARTVVHLPVRRFQLAMRDDISPFHF